MRIDVPGPTTPAIAPTSAKAIDAWRVGQILHAMVVSADAQGTMTLKINNAFIQAQAHRQLPALTGQSLQLQVTSTRPQTVLQVMNLSAKDDPITRALRTALPQQTTLTPFLTNIARLADPGANKASAPTPQSLIQLAQQFFNNLASTAQVTTAAGLKEAVNNSGTFLESKLAQLAGDNPDIRLPLSLDFKAGLLLLRQALTTQAPMNPPQDVLAAPRHAAPEPPVSGNRPAPPVPGAPTPTIITSAAPNVTLELTTSLATQVEGALARLHVNQLASLSSPPGSPLWAMELPLRHDNQIDLLQLRIEQDATMHTAGAQERSWSISLGLELEDLGPVYARITLLGQQVSVTLWAEENATAILANHHMEHLQHGLTHAGFHTGTLQCQPGKPPHATPTDTLLTGTTSLLDTHA